MGFQFIGRRAGATLLWGTGVMALTLGSLPAQACNACTTEGECVYVSTSGNCSCEIKVTDRGFQMCKPRGICDPQDVNSCGEGGPMPTGKSVRVSAAGLLLLEGQDPLIGHAIRGAAQETFGRDGWSTGTFLAFGIHEGTMKDLNQDVGYRYRVVVSQGKAGRPALRGSITSEAGEVIEFQADLREGGRSGSVVVERDDRAQGTPRSLSWGMDGKPEPN